MSVLLRKVPPQKRREVMNQLRRLIIALAAICVLALGAFALVNRPAVPAPSDDDIIIKGGSLEIQCGKNHKNDNAGCLSLDDGTTGKFKHKQDNKHILQIIVKPINGNDNSAFFTKSFDNTNQPEIDIRYK
jgi:hypothetical protein